MQKFGVGRIPFCELVYRNRKYTQFIPSVIFPLTKNQLTQMIFATKFQLCRTRTQKSMSTEDGHDRQQIVESTIDFMPHHMRTTELIVSNLINSHF